MRWTAIYIEKKVLKDIAEIKFSLQSKDKNPVSVKCITVAQLLPKNSIESFDSVAESTSCSDIKILAGDILIRRIAPSYVNYIDKVEGDIYVGNNLIIIRAKSAVDSRYLAFYLNTYIDTIIKQCAKGTAMPTLNRGDLERVMLPLPSLQKQAILGNLWFLSTLRESKTEQLHNLISKKMLYYLKHHIRAPEDKQ